MRERERGERERERERERDERGGEEVKTRPEHQTIRGHNIHLWHMVSKSHGP